MSAGVPPTRLASLATLPARGRDTRPMTSRVFVKLMPSRSFDCIRHNDAAPIPPLYGEGGRRRRTGGVFAPGRSVFVA